MNFHLVSHVIGGFGLLLGTEFGKEQGETIKDAYEIAPYTILEFEITPYIIFGASVKPVAYHTKTVGHEKVRE